MYDSALIYRTNLSALFSKEFLCASQAFLRLCIGFSSAVPGSVLVESELRQEVLFPSRVWLIAPPWNFLHRGGTYLCVFRYLVMLQSLSLSATCVWNLSICHVSHILTCHKLSVERWTLNTRESYLHDLEVHVLPVPIIAFYTLSKLPFWHLGYWEKKP